MSSQQIILVILIAYLVANVLIGVLYAKKRDAQSALSEEKRYFIGGRGMSGFLLAMTTMATYTSVSSFVSGPGAAGMTYGYAQVWIAAVQVPVTFLVLGVLGNKLALVSRRTGAVTVVGYLKARYKSDALVIATSLLLVSFFIAQMIAQFTGGATLVQSVTGIDYKLSLLIFALVVVAYTAVGGFTAVVVTDAIQGIVMCVGTFLFLLFVLKAGGGLAGIDAGLQANLPGTYSDLFAKYKPGTLLSFWILVGFGTLGLPQTAVRAMGFKNTKSLHSAMWIGAICCSFVIVGMHLAGAWAGALVDGAELPTSDYFIPYIVHKIMPPRIAGIFLAAPMAAVMSTADSLLILASAAIVRDLWKEFVVRNDPEKIKKYEKNVGLASIFVTTMLGLVTVFLALDPPNIIFFLNLFAMGGLECSFFWPLVGGLFWKKGTKQAAVASSIGAAASYVLCYYFVKVAGINAVVWGLLIGGIIYFAVGQATSKNGLDPDVLEKCF
ncbi:MAG TPA: sodium/pantothenate symporter [Bacillota bacterium]|nr:sodium/pantothenate symporter [Bacillota bacterium]